MTYSGHLGDWYVPVWVPKYWCPKNTSFFQLYFNKYVEVVINNFTMHLIILKLLRKQKCKNK